MLPDIEKYIERFYSAEHQQRAKSLIASAVLHDDTVPSPRCLRAALAGSRGSITQLECLVELLKIDYRDVIVAGEYEGSLLTPVKVRDLNEPFFSRGN